MKLIFKQADRNEFEEALQDKLSEMIDEEFEIDDPIGMHQQDYRDAQPLGHLGG